MTGGTVRQVVEEAPSQKRRNDQHPLSLAWERKSTALLQAQGKELVIVEALRELEGSAAYIFRKSIGTLLNPSISRSNCQAWEGFDEVDEAGVRAEASPSVCNLTLQTQRDVPGTVSGDITAQYHQPHDRLKILSGESQQPEFGVECAPKRSLHLFDHRLQVTVQDSRLRRCRSPSGLTEDG